MFILIIFTSCQTNYDLLSIDTNGSLTITSEFTDLNYNPYLKKIWIVKNRDTNANIDYPSFFITNIENNIITGNMSVGIRAVPNCYVKSFENKYLIEFSGIIENGIGKCQYNYKKNNTKGEMELIFKNNEIEATINSESKDDPIFSNIHDEKYIFQPYNIQDEELLLDVKNYETKLNSWGNVNITTGYINAYHPYAVVYITDIDGNILYVFEGLTNGIKIKDLKIEDINNDNLLDIKIMLDYTDLEYIYIQMGDGLFYNSKLDINTNISNLAPLP